MGDKRSKRHIHKYHFLEMSPGNSVWACASPDCNHYMPPNMAKMIVGKASECWECDNTLILSPDRLAYALEHNEGRALCQSCINRREGIAEIDPDELVLKVLGEK